MEKCAAALGTCPRPLPLQQLIRGTMACSRGCRWGFVCFERRISTRWTSEMLLAPRAARLALTLASESDPTDAVEDSSVSAMITTTFMLKRKCEYGQGFAVVGASPLLGAWNPAEAPRMEWSDDHVWKCQVDLPVGQKYEYKFVLTSKKDPVWQPGPNRVVKVEEDTTSPLVISEDWATLETDVAVEEGAAESGSKLVEEILGDKPVQDFPGAMVENVLETAGESVVKLVEEVLQDTAEDKNGGATKEEHSTEDEKGGASKDVAVLGAAEESEADKGDTAKAIPEETEAVATVEDTEEKKSSDSESSEHSASESSDSEEKDETLLAVDEQGTNSKSGSINDVPEDSKGFKNFKFEAQQAEK